MVARVGVPGGLVSVTQNDPFAGYRPRREELCAGAGIEVISRLLKDRINGASRMLGHFFMYDWLRGEIEVKLTAPRKRSIALPKLVLEALMLRECGHKFKGKFNDKEAAGAFATTAVMLAFGFPGHSRSSGVSAPRLPSLNTSSRGHGANSMLRTMAGEGLSYVDVDDLTTQQIDDLGVSDVFIDACRDMSSFMQGIAMPSGGNGFMDRAMSRLQATPYTRWVAKAADPQPKKPVSISVSPNDGLFKYALREEITDTTCARRALRTHQLTASLSLSSDEIGHFGGRPLGLLHEANVTRTVPVLVDAPTALPSACKQHRNAQSAVAKELLGTVELDLKEAHDGTTESQEELMFLLTDAIEDAWTKTDGSFNSMLSDALGRVDAMRTFLETEQSRIMHIVSTGMHELHALANQSNGNVAASAIWSHRLRRLSETTQGISSGDLVAALISASAVSDLQRLNPFLTNQRAEDALNAQAALMLRTVKLAQVRRTFVGCVQLLGVIKKIIERRLRAALAKSSAVPTQYPAEMVRVMLKKCAWSLDGAYANIVSSFEAMPSTFSDAHMAALAFCAYDGPEAARVIAHGSVRIGTSAVDVTLAQLHALALRGMYAGDVKLALQHTSGVDLMSNRALKAELQLTAKSLIGMMGAKRHYLGKDLNCTTFLLEDRTPLSTSEDPRSVFDPRFLVFEFLTGFLLRQRQVELVLQFVRTREKDGANAFRVQQMIMGGGKTSVVGPLCCLMLADRKSLVVTVCPASLLDQSRRELQKLFSGVLHKRVFTLAFHRAMKGMREPKNLARIRRKLAFARADGSVVVTTPGAVKSMMLFYLDLMLNVKEKGEAQPLLLAPRFKVPSQAMRFLRKTAMRLHKQAMAADNLGSALRLLGSAEGGIAMVDEVDLLLHPLKSELNYPVGDDKVPLHLAQDNYRWYAAMHMFEPLFHDGGPMCRKRYCMPDAPPNTSRDALKARIWDRIRNGIDTSNVGSSPHVVLLNHRYYKRILQPLFAEWAVAWLVEIAPVRSVLRSAPLGLSSGAMKREMIRFLQEEPSVPLTSDADALVAHETALEDQSEILRCLSNPTQGEMNPNGIAYSLLNLMKSWTTMLLPHCFSKIHRVKFGLLRENDLLHLGGVDAVNDNRKLLAVPFVGKDAPSPTSEFAHPDAIIGLSILAYRYDGLRVDDMASVLRQLKDRMRIIEMGPIATRPTHKRFERWKSFCGKAGANLLPLDEIEPGNPDDVAEVHEAMARLPEIIHMYLAEIVFPKATQHKPAKLSASGVDLGGGTLFGACFGFSGTPSAMLPTKMRDSVASVRDMMEKGSDAAMIRNLTSTGSDDVVGVTNVEIKSRGWTVDGLLELIACHDAPSFNALIDTGALITGLTNEEVARELLRVGLEGIDVCVFFDDDGRQLFVDRNGGSAAPLSRCGVSKERRFAFYDQVHTTGTDLKHKLDAVAAVTLGKDMTLRDYTQGCYRMRGIGKGQRIFVIMIQEIQQLVLGVVNPEDALRVEAGGVCANCSCQQKRDMRWSNGACSSTSSHGSS
jgi:hypothetical protein